MPRRSRISDRFFAILWCRLCYIVSTESLFFFFFWKGEGGGGGGFDYGPPVKCFSNWKILIALNHNERPQTDTRTYCLELFMIIQPYRQPVVLIVTFDINCLNILQFHTADDRCFTSTLTENPLFDSAS